MELQETHQTKSWRLTPIQLFALALAALWVCFLLSGCDGEYERQRAKADFNERFVNAALPKIGEPRTCEVVLDKIVCYSTGKKRQPQVVANLWEAYP